ncbi:MAG: hypothetical protein E7235_02125 [Lachnospiraceae bacterium]|nr:hypothetical protein [Lachnospiraceae bacterium]
MYDSDQSVALESGEDIAVLNDGAYAETHHEHHEHVHHLSPVQEKWLVIRNLFVAVAAVLFLVSLTHFAAHAHMDHTLKAVAYMFGACAYGSEFLMLTECFKKKQPAKELFMPAVFGVLYIILGISYFMH